jgi:hypothetical protein
MKTVITLKDPDGFSNGVADAVTRSLDAISGLSEAEKKVLLQGRFEKTWAKLEQFVFHEECLTVEFDTEVGTATVMECK